MNWRRTSEVSASSSRSSRSISGNGVFVAQQYGAGERAEVGEVTDVGLALSVATGVAVGVVMFAAAPRLIGVLVGDADLAGPAVTYLRILACAVPVASAIFTLQSAFSGFGAVWYRRCQR